MRVARASSGPKIPRRKRGCIYETGYLRLFTAKVQPDHWPSYFADDGVVVAAASPFELRFGREEMSGAYGDYAQHNQAEDSQENRIVETHAGKSRRGSDVVKRGMRVCKKCAAKV
jgi:hypothetical protein